MRIALQAQPSPNDASVETVLPGVLNRLDVHGRQLSTLDGKVTNIQQNQTEVLTFIKNANQFFQQGAYLAGQHFGNPAGASVTAANHMMMSVPAIELPPQNNPHNNCQQQLFLSNSYKSLVDIWSEWYGLHQFQGKPVVGGFEKLEELQGRKWRAHFNNGQKLQFSRSQAVIKAVKTYCERIPGKEGKEIEVLANWDPDYKVKCRSSLSIYKEHLQNLNLLPKRKSPQKRKETS